MQYVYLIKSKYTYTEVYKIGIANDPQSRLAQLQTGNPYQLEIVSCYGFEDAGVVEKSLHQAYKEERLQGEWFELNHEQIEEFETICTLLKGQPSVLDDHAAVDEIDEAEEMQSMMAEGGKFDYSAMFADGWRMEKSTSKGVNGRYWCWRKGSEVVGRKYIYGGLIDELPHSLEDMRKIFDKPAVAQ